MFKVNVETRLNDDGDRTDTLEDQNVRLQKHSNYENHCHNNWTILLTVNNAYFDFFRTCVRC
jgi:hypothetical protein